MLMGSSVVVDLAGDPESGRSRQELPDAAGDLERLEVGHELEATFGERDLERPDEADVGR
jgi:hypothetical protein